jgi:hypothetical protein
MTLRWLAALGRTNEHVIDDAASFVEDHRVLASAWFDPIDVVAEECSDGSMRPRATETKSA